MRGLAILLGCLLLAGCGRKPGNGDGEDAEAALPVAPEAELSVAVSEAAIPSHAVLFPEREITSGSEWQVMSWNLEWFPGRSPASSDTDKLIQLTAAREILAGVSPDVFCVQEVRDATAVDQLVEALPGYKVHVISQFEGAQQIAIASKMQPVAAYFQKFTTTGASPPRGFAFAAYQEGDEYLLVYSVHLKSNRGGIEENIAKREESARQLVAHMDAVEKDLRAQGATSVAVILAGDFNTDPGDVRFAAETTGRILTGKGLAWGWERVPFAERVTWPEDGTYPDACFDHFFTRGLASPTNALVPGSEMASDHRAVLLRFNWGS